MWEPEEPKAETERKRRKSKSVDAVFVTNSLGPCGRTQAAALVLAERAGCWAIRTWCNYTQPAPPRAPRAKPEGESDGDEGEGQLAGKSFIPKAISISRVFPRPEI